MRLIVGVVAIALDLVAGEAGGGQRRGGGLRGGLAGEVREVIDRPRSLERVALGREPRDQPLVVDGLAHVGLGLHRGVPAPRGIVVERPARGAGQLDAPGQRLQIGAVLTPGVRDIFHVGGLSMYSWLLIVGLAFVPVSVMLSASAPAAPERMSEVIVPPQDAPTIDAEPPSRPGGLTSIVRVNGLTKTTTLGGGGSTTTFISNGTLAPISAAMYPLKCSEAFGLVTMLAMKAPLPPFAAAVARGAVAPVAAFARLKPVIRLPCLSNPAPVIGPAMTSPSAPASAAAGAPLALVGRSGAAAINRRSARRNRRRRRPTL